MKRVTYKKEFKSIEDALTKIPNQLKENNEVFEITDGNKTIKVRWEGSLTEGVAVPLIEKDNKLISEDITKMKSLMGYKPESVIGTPTANNRVDENKTFKNLLSSSKKKILNESLTIDEISNLHEIELLDEGVMSKIVMYLMALGFSAISAKAMAQENPKKAIDTIQQKSSQMSPEEVEIMNQKLGTTFTPDGANQILQKVEPFQGKEIQPLDLGAYGGIKVIKQIDAKSDKGKTFYTVEINDFYRQDSSKLGLVINDLKNQNKNLKNSIIRFVDQKGQPIQGRDLIFK